VTPPRSAYRLLRPSVTQSCRKDTDLGKTRPVVVGGESVELRMPLEELLLVARIPILLLLLRLLVLVEADPLESDPARGDRPFVVVPEPPERRLGYGLRRTSP